MDILSFDEWYELQHGKSFESMWMRQGMRYDESVVALVNATRSYLTYAVAHMAKK